jgi:hypothetical protein
MPPQAVPISVAMASPSRMDCGGESRPSERPDTSAAGTASETGHRHRKRRPHRKRHHQAEHDGGDRDTDLDPRHRHRGDAQDAANRHDQRKRHGENPYRRRSEHGAPQADRRHGGHMIGPEQRVSEPARKSCRNVAAAMGERGRRTGGAEEQRYRDGWNFAVP